MAITHDAMDLTVQPHCSSPTLCTWDLTGQGPSHTVQTCSLQDPPNHTGADIWWLLKHIRSAQAGGMHSTGMPSRVRWLPGADPGCFVRMCTVRCRSCLRGCLPGRCLPGGCLPRECLLGDIYPTRPRRRDPPDPETDPSRPRGRHPPAHLVDRIFDTLSFRENPQLRGRGGGGGLRREAGRRRRGPTVINPDSDECGSSRLFTQITANAKSRSQAEQFFFDFHEGPLMI